MSQVPQSDVLAQGVLWGTVVVISLAMFALARVRRLGALRDLADQRAGGIPPSGVFEKREWATTVAYPSHWVSAVVAEALVLCGQRVVAHGSDWCAGGAAFSAGPILCFVRWTKSESDGMSLTVTAERVRFDLPMPGLESTYVAYKVQELSTRVLGTILCGLDPAAAPILPKMSKPLSAMRVLFVVCFALTMVLLWGTLGAGRGEDLVYPVVWSMIIWILFGLGVLVWFRRSG